jgi:type I restriction enzyme S subunit
MPGLHIRYFEETLRSPACRRELQIRAKGIVEGFWRLYTDDFYTIRLPVPPPDEQAAIVRFLDHADRRIRRYIRVKQQLIKLLEEQKQAIIHQAVTRGLDPSVPMEDSGMPWVARVPSHWSPTPNRAYLKIRKALVGARHTEFQLLSLTKRGVIVRDLSENKGKFSADLGTSQEVRSGDLVCCLFDVPETPRTVGLSPHNGMITGAYTVFECRDPSVVRFIEAFYIAMDDRKLLSPLYSGLRNTIPKERFLGAKTPLPDDGERAAILDHIASTSANHGTAIDRARREVDLLRELRTRLISDVVTGQLDVRAAAAALPDEPTDEEPLDDADDAGDDDVDADAAPEDPDA